MELELKLGSGPAWGILLPYISLSEVVYEVVCASELEGSVCVCNSVCECVYVRGLSAYVRA